MANNSETGHAINVANFESLITAVVELGESYKPSKISLKHPALQTLSETAQNALNAVNVAQSAYSNAIDASDVAFEPFSRLITRINNALKASDTTPQVDESAQTIIRKLQGKRASAKISDAEKAAMEAEGKPVNQISASQLSYDNKMENFDKLLMLLESVPLYAPNEEDLKVTSLKTLHANLKTINKNVVTASLQLSNARIVRNEILYKPITGLVDIAADIKTYIKSVFGATSPQYKVISKLRFTAKKDRL